MRYRAIGSVAVVIGFSFAASVFSQSGREYRRSAIMRGNLVKSVFGNYGVIGWPAEKGCRGAWIYENNGYIGDVSPLVGAEIIVNGRKFHSVEICPVAGRPSPRHELSPSGKPWGFEPVSGYVNEKEQGVALYSDPSSWPPYWPDKQTDAADPGWAGSWNGYSGKTTTATEETFFVMDDQNDEEFNVADNNQWQLSFKPDSTNPSRNGLGLSVKVRGMQWSDFLAQDCIFWLYEITNTSTTDYDKVVFGMLVGTYLGCTGTDDSPHEYDDDYSFFDVEKDLTYTGDFDDDCSRNPRWTGPVGMVGYAFLESPGNMYDGIDNDGDADETPGVSATAPFFTEADFQSRTLFAGDKVVLIDRNYLRTVATVPATETVFITRNDTIRVIPGVTTLVEGDEVEIEGNKIVNANAYDGIDNDLDGLIDENYYLHYHQIRKDSKGKVLIDKLSPVRHKDFVNGVGLADGMIDERRDDGIDNDLDWNLQFDDVGADGIAGTNDRGEGDGLPTANEPNFDQTDKDESDQIGLTSFEYFAPAGELVMADDEDLWRRLSPGYFEVPASIVNNLPTRGEDGDFSYGSGYFPLRAGETQRFSLALVYGDGGGPSMDTEDLLKNRETVQKIYNSGYRFPPAPEKPKLTVVPGDGQVTLYWDRKAEDSYDPVLRTYDFEGYKIYRATDQNFNEVFEITDADGSPKSYKPIAQFDKVDGIKGYFRANSDLYQESRGMSFNLGTDNGLQHSYVDNNLENGRRYFYAVVAYDRGDEIQDIFPKENDMRIDVLPSGEVRTFSNTAVVIPNGPVAGYVPPDGSVQILPEQAVGTGQVYCKVLDETQVTGSSYRLEFWDTSNDGLDNDGDTFIDAADTSETMVPITTAYSVIDETGVTESFVSRDTLAVRLTRANLVESSVSVTDAAGTVIPSEKYRLDALNGRIQGKNTGDLPYGELFNIFFKYYPVFQSRNIERSPYAAETKDTDIFDGVRLSFNNQWTTAIDNLKSGWTDPTRAYAFEMKTVDTYFDTDVESVHLLGLPHPSDYRIEFSDGVADTSISNPDFFMEAIPVNFRIYNMTDGRYLDFSYTNPANNKKLSPFDEIWLAEKGLDGIPTFTWDLYFTHRMDTVFTFGAGDTLRIIMDKPFRRGDAFAFQTAMPKDSLDLAKSEIDRIRVVPNPYVAATSQELPLPPAVTSGRGERKIDFIHLPADAVVHLFTARGEHIVTLRQDGSLFDGTVSWNLKTKENLDVAAGVYFYVVDSKAGVKRGKVAIIK